MRRIAFTALLYGPLSGTRPAPCSEPIVFPVQCSLAAGDLPGHKLLLTSVRTGDPEIFVVATETGAARNVTRSPPWEDRYSSWFPNGKRTGFMSDSRASWKPMTQ